MDLALLLLDQCVLLGFLLIKLLLESPHESVHHEITILLHIEGTSQLLVLFLELLKLLIPLLHVLPVALHLAVQLIHLLAV